jgi:hypothetical protein
VMTSFLPVTAAGAMLLIASQVIAQSSAFTYQGRLTQDGISADGDHDFRFRLYELESGGTPVGPSLTLSAVTVVEGLFSTALDFGQVVFDGADRWLEIDVRPHGTDVFVTLAPRQPLTPTPYALHARALSSGAITTEMLADGAVSTAKLQPGTLSRLERPNGSGPSAVTISSDGWMGVGTATPDAALSVMGGRAILEPRLRFQVQDETPPWANLGGAVGLAVSGDLLAVAAPGDNAVSLVDVADPASPILRSVMRDGTGGYANLAGAVGVALRGSLLAIAAETDHAVTLVTVTNPALPVLRSSLRDGSGIWTNLAGARAVAFSTGGILAVAASQANAVTLIIAADPSTPGRIGVLRDGEPGFRYLAGASDVAWSGNLLAIAAPGDHAVTLVTVSLISPPETRAVLVNNHGDFHFLGGARAVAFSGSLLAIAADTDGAVTLVDVSNPATPVLRAVMRRNVGSVQGWSAPCALAFSGQLLAVADRVTHRISWVDVSDPTQPRILAMAGDGLGGASYLRSPQGVIFAGTTVAATGSADSGLTLFTLEDRTAAFNTDGWVGIGTSLPQASLHVAGDVRVEGDRAGFYVSRFEAGEHSRATGFNSTALGAFTSATGNQSTAIGYQTRAEASTSLAMGISTVASGPNAVAIGIGNTASGQSAVAVGSGCIADGTLAIAVGNGAEALARNAMAFGFRAQALHTGSFVWADATAQAVATSTADNEFTARASGGVRFFSNNRQDTGSRIAPGGNSWSSVSDRAVKENQRAIDPRVILEKVADLPVTEWNLVSQDPSIRHLGPMAQDFHAAFGLGEDDRHISSSNADGVAFAAIQGLYHLLRERDDRIADLEARLTALEHALTEPPRRDCGSTMRGVK